MTNRLQRATRMLPFLAGAIFLAAFLPGCARQSISAEAPPANSASLAKVHTIQPQWKSVQHVVQQPGTVQAYEETQLFARVPGYVEHVRADIGQRVAGPRHDETGKEIEPGQVLAEISVPELAREAEQKQALSRQAEAEAEQARKALVSADASIGIAEAAVVEARAQRDRWSSESKRIARLVEGGTLDVQTRDETINQAKATEARLLAAEATVRKARADRDKTSADVQAAEARISVAKADAQRSQAILSYSKIRAPFAGIVTGRRVNTGDLVQPSGGKGEWLFRIARLDPVRVVVFVPEADAELVQEKAKVTLNIRAAQRDPIHAAVSRTSWSLESDSRTLRAEVDLPNQQGRLRPGMYVYAQIENSCPSCWTVPAAAVTKQGDAMVCFVIVDGKAVRTEVQVGHSDGKIVELLKKQTGGSPSSWAQWTGKEVVANRTVGLTDGQSVQAVADPPVPSTHQARVP